MSKHKSSKLDPYAERLTEWFLSKEEGGQALTLDEVKEQLALDGLKVACSTLSEWWQRRCSERRQARLLDRIATGASQVKEVNEAFEANPAPGMETIANLHRLIAFQLATDGRANPEMLELSTKMTKTVLEFGKLEAKKADQELAEKKFKALEWKLERAREELQKLKEPKAIDSEEERKKIVEKVDEVLGLK